MKHDPDLLALVDRLRPWLAVDPTTPDYPRSPLSWAGDGEGALGIVVAWDDAEISVALSAWRQVWPRDDADTADEVLDLVAAARVGLVRVRISSVGDRPFRWDVEFRVGTTWQLHDTVTRGRGPWGWLRSATEQLLVNRGSAPPGFEVRNAGALPRAPWVGVLAPTGGAAAVVVEPDGELDLHTFKPKQVRPVVEAYLEACRERGITQVRIVHGKGIGNLRRTVHALLERHPAVASFRLGGMGEGSWGATVVDLHPPTRRDG